MLRTYLRTCAIGVSAGAIAGILIGGLGGRLAMRILAATSGDDVQGAITDAEERVGDITVGGTLGFVIFVGIFGGIVGGVVFVALRRWLPQRAWMAGLAIGLLLLFFARLDPLDPESIDLEILTPDLLAVALFLTLFPLYGMTMASLVSRFERSYPRLSRRPRAIAAYLPLAPTLLVPPVALALVAGAIVDVFAKAPAFARVWRDRGVDLAGRAVLVARGCGERHLGRRRCRRHSERLTGYRLSEAMGETNMSVYTIPPDSEGWEFDSPATTAFDWVYDDGRAQLLRLYDKGTRKQWIGSDRLDWSHELDPENPLGMPDEVIAINGTPWWDKMNAAERGEVRRHLQAGSSRSSCTASRARSSAPPRSSRPCPTSTRSSTPPRR